MRLNKKISILLSTLIISAIGFTTNIKVIKAEEIATLKNLALNKSVAINAPDKELDKLMGVGELGTPITEAYMLTNDKPGDLSNWNGGTWFKFYRNMKRELVVDLEKVNTIKSISMSFAQRNDVGIVPPYYLKYYASDDGQNYSYLGASEPDIPLYVAHVTAKDDVQKKVYKLDKLANGEALNIQARYIKISFVNMVWSFADKIEILGKEGIVDGAILPPEIKDEAEPIVNKYPDRNSDKSAKITDQFLFYSGAYAQPDITHWSIERAEYALAYKDIYGTTKDWYYDDMLVLPVAAIENPSGKGKFKVKSDFDSWLDFIFKEETQLGALNKAAGNVNKSLGTNKKVRINMSIPILETSANFGDIKGDGSLISTDPNAYASYVKDSKTLEGKMKMAQMAIESRTLIAKWYINEVVKRFNAAGYENLYLDSFYWHHEKIDPSIGENFVVKDIAKYLKGNNYYFTWIPYLGTDAPYIWKELGFDAVSIQPNFAFGAKYSKVIVEKTAELAKKFGMAVEIEYSDFATLAQYLNESIDSRYLKDTFHTYYYGGALPIVSCGTALNPIIGNQAVTVLSPIQRAVYDRLYEFKEGTYTKQFSMILNPDVKDKNNIVVSAIVKYADNFMEGEFTVYYDSSKLNYKGYDLGAQFPKDKGTLAIDSSKPGVLKVIFKINDKTAALSSDKTGAANAMDVQLVKFNFNKKDNVLDVDITNELFGIDKEGKLVTVEGMTYSNWSEYGLINNSSNSNLANLIASVKKAEDTKEQIILDRAKELLKTLPDNEVKKDITNRISKAQIAVNEDLMNKSLESLEKAEESKSQADVDFAKALVDKLTEGEAKKALMDRLVLVQKAIDDSKVVEEIKNPEVPKLPKTGSMINSKSLVALGGFIVLLGIVIRKK